MYRGMASHILGEGADGVYLFNYYFGDLYNRQQNNLPLLEEGGLVRRTRTPELLNEIGSLATLQGRNKIYCMSDGVTDAYRALGAAQLPVAVSSGRATDLTVQIADSLKSYTPEEMILFLRTNRPANINLEVNGTKITEQNRSTYTFTTVIVGCVPKIACTPIFYRPVLCTKERIQSAWWMRRSTTISS